MTAQAHEKLILDGEHTSLACVPPLPFDHPRLRRRKLNVISRPSLAAGIELTPDQEIALVTESTACTRGYIGSWQIVSDRFHLLRVEGHYKLVGSDPLFADWFTGCLRVPAGEKLHYVHHGFATVYAEELFIEVEKGVVVERFRQDNRHRTSGLYSPLSKASPDPDELSLTLGFCVGPPGVVPRRFRELLQRLDEATRRSPPTHRSDRRY